MTAVALTGLQTDRLDVNELILVELGEDGHVAALGHDEVVGALVGVSTDALHLIAREGADVTGRGRGGSDAGRGSQEEVRESIVCSVDSARPKA